MRPRKERFVLTSDGTSKKNENRTRSSTLVKKEGQYTQMRMKLLKDTACNDQGHSKVMTYVSQNSKWAAEHSRDGLFIDASEMS